MPLLDQSHLNNNHKFYEANYVLNMIDQMADLTPSEIKFQLLLFRWHEILSGLSLAYCKH